MNCPCHEMAAVIAESQEFYPDTIKGERQAWVRQQIAEKIRARSHDCELTALRSQIATLTRERDEARAEAEKWKRGVANRDDALKLCAEARDRYAKEATLARQQLAEAQQELAGAEEVADRQRQRAKEADSANARLQEQVAEAECDRDMYAEHARLGAEEREKLQSQVAALDSLAKWRAEELAKAEAISAGRLRELERVAAEKNAEWRRAENAEAERDAAERRARELEARELERKKALEVASDVPVRTCQALSAVSAIGKSE